MQATYVSWQQRVLLTVFFVALSVFVVAACGMNDNGTATGSTPSPTPTPATIAGYGSAYGCPSDVVVSKAPAAADVTVTTKQGNTTISAQRGDVMEIHLPFGLVWKGPTTSQGALQLQTPTGYAWKPSNACIWRFVAKDTGVVKLTFFGRAICQKAALCVPSVEVALFTIKVS